ncbi:MAG: hypothetical protein EBU46_20925, partial [Nitrosomonadaceae bacterium]|nr:hypothetical protein [Nitrosomonadaceae bacterium]
ACFNAAVRICKESADPPPRNWDSPQFVDVYSTRCGSVYQLLNPRSELNRVYAPQVVPRLLSGALTYAELGSLPERDLCPAALAEERAKIADRCRAEELAKLGLKVSTIFQCPHCKQRRCTYTEIQRRSLDEPPDYLCECLNPMCRRKFNGQT